MDEFLSMFWAVTQYTPFKVDNPLRQTAGAGEVCMIAENQEKSIQFFLE